MFRSRIVLIAFFLSISTSYSQYLEFDDFINLIDLAEERSEAIKFLESKNFEFFNYTYIIEEGDNAKDESHYVVEFRQTISDDDYEVRVVSDTDKGQCYLVEISSNPGRSKYFTSELSNLGIESSEKSDDGEGNIELNYKTEQYEIIITEYINLAGVQKNSFSISTFKK